VNGPAADGAGASRGERLDLLLVAWPLGRVAPDAVGGAEQVLGTLERGLARRGHRTTVVAAEGSAVEGTLEALPLPPPPHDAAAQALQHERVRAALARLLAARRFDLVHLHGVDFDHYLPPPGPPALATLHLPAAWYAPAALAPSRAATFLHCVSRSQRRALGATPALLEAIVPNGVDTGAFRPAPHKGSFALALGRVSPEKGFDLGLAAAHRAGVAMVLAGQVFPFPAHEQHFREAVAPLLDARRVFIGPVGPARKRRLLAGARCLVVPSRAAETSSIAAMEALASGTPVVAFRVGALPEIVEEGETGFLVERVEEMAVAIRAAGELSSPACRRAAEERFSAERMVERYEVLYREVIARAATSSVRPEPFDSGRRAAYAQDRLRAAESKGAARPAARRSLHVELLSGLPALEGLRLSWEALWSRDPRATAFQHPDWILPWCRRFWREPFAIAVRCGGALVGLAPLHAHAWQGRRLVQLASGPLADFQDLLAEPDHATTVAALVLEELAARAATGEVVELDGLREGSPLLATPSPPALLDDVAAVESCPELALPEDPTRLRDAVPRRQWEGYAYERRRVARAGALAFDLATADTFDARFDDLARLHALRWSARGEPGGVIADPAILAFHRDAARALHARGALRLWSLRLDGRAVAATYGWSEHGAAAVYLTGFDPSAARLSPGKVLLGEAIEAAAREGARAYHFLRGREAYKYAWGARDRPSFRRRIAAGSGERAAPHRGTPAHPRS
jgi:CelD/BcsL family acetyltransferase involved in cellulose biosynthesis/glycosyltransferase involved in cell wall biosynthesis